MRSSDINIHEYGKGGCWIGLKDQPVGEPGEIIDVDAGQILFVQGEDGQRVTIDLPADAVRAIRDALSRQLLTLQPTDLDRAIVAVQELRKA